MSVTDAIVGYADPLVLTPGQVVDFKISTACETFTSQILRLGVGPDNPHGPPKKHYPVEDLKVQTHAGRMQYGHPGSFIRVADWQNLSGQDVKLLVITGWFYATKPQAGHEQYLFSTIQDETHPGLAAFLDTSGGLALMVQSGGEWSRLDTSIILTRDVWYQLTFTMDLEQQRIELSLLSKGPDLAAIPENHTYVHTFEKPLRVLGSAPLLIAGGDHNLAPTTVASPSTTFNGKIDDFKITAKVGDTSREIIHFDFSLDMSADAVRDISPDGRTGQLINAPTRAVRGHNYDGTWVDWTVSQYGYGAIHFHDDDVDDANWDTVFSVQLPQSLLSGFYAALVDDGKTHDYIPFFVSPKEDAKRAEVAFIVPTFTYGVYANEKLYNEVVIPGAESDGWEMHKGHHYQVLEARSDFGKSLYDRHSDGSGSVFSSTKRPVLNMRPDYIHWGFLGPRHFPADLWFIGFLDRELGTGNYDVITDHDLNAHGSSLLKKYKVVLSGSHPEYPTFKMMSAYLDFIETGGRFCYLGGNGYYWCTVSDVQRPHRLELRRAGLGSGSFLLPAGEGHHQLTGEFGGVWSQRGFPAAKFTGLMAAAVGIGKGAAYGVVEKERTNPKIAFVLKGLENDKVIGDYGLLAEAASGDELDRVNYDMGSPQNLVVIANTKLTGGHSDNYQGGVEDMGYPLGEYLGTKADHVRSDMIYYDTPKGGAVFSVGSINWIGSVAWNNYQNDVAKVTSNVLHEFLKRP